MLLNWKELLLRIISIPSMLFFSLNLGRKVSGYLSIQNEMACFPNSRRILLYRFVTSNVTEWVRIKFFSYRVLKIYVVLNIAFYSIHERL